jgi:hypothetical protein
MRCLLCDAEMILMNVVQDDTMLVAGFEHHTFMCPSCHDVERRFVFVGAAKATPVPATPAIAGEQSESRPVPPPETTPVTPISAVQDEPAFALQGERDTPLVGVQDEPALVLQDVPPGIQGEPVVAVERKHALEGQDERAAAIQEEPALPVQDAPPVAGQDERAAAVQEEPAFPVQDAPPVADQDERAAAVQNECAAAPGMFSRVVARLRGR